MITQAQNDHYKKNKSDWHLIHSMVTGEDAKEHLNKRYFEIDGRREKMFQKRKENADFTPYTQHLLSRLVGLLFQRYEEVQRSLGNATEEQLENIGPKGEDYRVLLIELAETLLAYDEAYMVYDPKGGLQIVNPLSVPNFNGRDFVVKGTRMKQGSVKSDIGVEETYKLYAPNGYEVYVERETENGNPKAKLIESGLWASNEDGQAEVSLRSMSGAERAPVIRVQMPWSARLGLQIARKNRSIYEMESRQDFALGTAMNGIIQSGVGEDEDLAQEISDKATSSMIWPYDKSQGEHKGLQMPVEGPRLAREIIKDKIKNLRMVAFNSLEQAGRKTAKEVQLRQSGGAGAALTILSQTIGDADKMFLHLLNQVNDWRLTERSQDISTSASWPTGFSTPEFLEEDSTEQTNTT